SSLTHSVITFFKSFSSGMLYFFARSCKASNFACADKCFLCINSKRSCSTPLFFSFSSISCPQHIYKNYFNHLSISPPLRGRGFPQFVLLISPSPIFWRAQYSCGILGGQKSSL